MEFTYRFPGGRAPTSFPSDYASQFLREINRARTNPQAYIPVIQRYASQYPESEIRDAVQYMRSRPACQPYTLNPLLSQMSQTWANEQGRTGSQGHGNLAQRLRTTDIPLISGTYTLGENIAYGFVDPTDIIVAWIIDYQVPGKGHRLNLFKCDQTQIGIGYGTHPEYRVMVVNDYGAGFASSR